MPEFVEAGLLDRIPPGSGATATIAGRQIALFNVEGTIYAMDDSFLHHGASLGSGKLEGKIVTCRAHGWKYNVETGATLNVPDYGVSSYPVKVVDGKILVALP